MPVRRGRRHESSGQCTVRFNLSSRVAEVIEAGQVRSWQAMAQERRHGLRARFSLVR